MRSAAGAALSAGPFSRGDSWLPYPRSYSAILPVVSDPRIDAIERLSAAMNAHDLDGIAAVMTAEVVGDWTRSTAPYAGMYRSRREVRSFFEGLMEAFSEMVWETELLDEVRGGALLVRTRLRGTGRGSGVAIDARGAVVMSFDGPLIAEVTLYQSPDEARLDLRRARLRDSRLYFVCDGRPGDGDAYPLLDVVLTGGVDVIQLREKAPRCAEEIVALAEPFRRAADEHGALFILNDHPELVEATGADGVHVGQDDHPVAQARALVGPGALVGLSTHSTAQFDAAVAATGDARPDQLSVGPVWETPTKPGRAATGLEYVTHAAAADTELPWFAIGGIDEANVGEIVGAGGRRAVVVRAIRDAGDPGDVARGLRDALVSQAAG